MLLIIRSCFKNSSHYAPIPGIPYEPAEGLDGLATVENKPGPGWTSRGAARAWVCGLFSNTSLFISRQVRGLHGERRQCLYPLWLGTPYGALQRLIQAPDSTY